MQDTKKIIEQLNDITDDKFYQIETELYLALQTIPNEKKTEAIITFLSISNWQATSLRSGVWTYYEIANTNDLLLISKYLVKTQQKELANIFTKGIHDYQNPKYALSFNYPDEWIKEAEIIDTWIFNNENEIIEWKRKVLIEILTSIECIR